MLQLEQKKAMAETIPAPFLAPVCCEHASSAGLNTRNDA
jgi:hypothetical protein